MTAEMLRGHALEILVAAIFVIAMIFIVYRIVSLRFFPVLTARKLNRVQLGEQVVKIPFFIRLKLAALISESEVGIVRKIMPEFVDKKKSLS